MCGNYLAKVVMFLGVAGSYRKHEQVSVVYTHSGRQLVANLTPVNED